MPANPEDRFLAEQNSGGDYRDYIQMLIPETGQLDGITLSFDGCAAHSVPAESITYEFQKEDIAYWVIVPHGGSATLVFTYEGPFADISRTRVIFAWLGAPERRADLAHRPVGHNAAQLDAGLFE